MTESTAYQVKRIRRKYQIFRVTEILLWSACISCLSFYLARLFTPGNIVPAISACLTGCATAFAGFRWLNLLGITDDDLARYLNRNYPSLRESADLLLRKQEELTPLQKLQRAKTILRFHEIYPSIKLPHRIGQALVVAVFSLVAGIASTSFLKGPGHSVTSENPPEKNVVTEKMNFPAAIQEGTITISPPSYTRIKTTSTHDFDLRVPEGSTVVWDIIFEGPVSKVQLLLSGKDTIAFSGNSRDYDLRHTCTESGFYQLAWEKDDSYVTYSDYYKLEVVKDNPPTIVIENQKQFVELAPTDNLKTILSSVLADDYGISQAYIIATVSKGSGEAIKFREQKLLFDSPQKISGKKIPASRTIDLVDLGLLPGDELYFYVEAFDIKKPTPNRARTETYFITLQDTSEMMTSVDASLGVNLIPEYFRSQRQIIIDSEKLLKERNKASRSNFNLRSNELAHDQKVLRLRYGEFLGEEFESGIVPQHEVPPLENDDEGEGIRKKFGHEHDRINENGQVDEKSGKKETHTHGAGESSGNKKQDPLRGFVHAHDDAEEATFFIQSIRAKLKAALTIMWDAELYLRLYQPDKSLPYQYSALKLLKEISQESRIYVHRTGFDPPPLKEEKRLTADLSQIENSISESRQKGIEPYENIRKAIITVERLIATDTIALTETEKNNLTAAGRELALLELKNPGGYLKTLSQLKMMVQHEIQDHEATSILLEIRSSLWKALPHNTVQPQPTTGIAHELDLEFLKRLEPFYSHD